MTKTLPYPMKAAVGVDTRHAQMLTALEVAKVRGMTRLEQRPMNDTAALTIACYGPSLRHTWKDIKHPILSMSGATHFLAERGIVADYHVDMDPRRHKVQHLIPPVRNVHYLMASVCPPQTWEVLKDEQVTLWHTYSGKEDGGRDTYRFVAEHDPGEPVVSGGSTIGLAAIRIGGILGYRHFEIHGMDGSLALVDEELSRHAGPHYGKPQNDGYTWNAEGVKYHTSQIMANAVQETLNLCATSNVFCVFHGEGLTQALIREASYPNACTANQTEKVERVRTMTWHVPPGSVQFGQHKAWDDILGSPDPSWLADLQAIWADGEARRSRAKFNTGSIPLETGLLLRSLCAWAKPKIVIEVGTFVGKSTRAMTSDFIFTCDRDNDCLDSTDRIYTYPYRTSTYMLKDLVEQGVSAELFFFDGRLADEDLPLISQLCHDDSIYAFDDYHPGGKGEANVAKLLPQLKDYAFVSPNPSYAGRSTLALLVPCK